MGRIELEKLVANLRDTYGYPTTGFTLVGDAALVIHGVIKEVTKPVMYVSNEILKGIAGRRDEGIKVYDDEVYGKVQYVDMGNALLIMPMRVPKYHCNYEEGPFTVETLSTIIMLLCVGGIEKNMDKIRSCFGHGGYLLLEAWDSDLDYIGNIYSSYPEIYEVLDGEDEGSTKQVMWKSVMGIEGAKDDYIYLSNIGMMYIETN